jgi:hypothetical protein
MLNRFNGILTKNKTSLSLLSRAIVGQSAGKFFEQYTEKGALILVKNSV